MVKHCIHVARSGINILYCAGGNSVWFLLSELLAYMNLIVRASTKYKWPLWVIYDHNFRLEAAMGEQVDWAKSDASLFAQCFTGQALIAWNFGAMFGPRTIQCPYAPPQPKRPNSSVSCVIPRVLRKVYEGSNFRGFRG